MEVVNGQYLLRLLVEDKTVPAAVIKRRLLEMCDKIEKNSGRRPGRQYQRELKEQITQELLPQAFPRQRGFNVWIEPGNRWILVDATSPAAAGMVLTALVKAFEGLAVSDMQTRTAPAVAMAQWLLDGAPSPWSVGMSCDLRSDDGMGSLVRHARMNVQTSDIREHLDNGMRPSQLELNWGQRVDFVLTHDLKLKGIDFMDIVFEGGTDDLTDVFDADAAIATGELRELLQDLVQVLDGRD